MNSPRTCRVALYVSDAAGNLVSRVCTNLVPFGQTFPLCCMHSMWLNRLACGSSEGFQHASAIMAAAGASESRS